ncbi:SAM-dependent methyltransferase [Alkalisalibacterium limincola]|uniref:Class I SAM-dependent methyltransferase n=1 Tax=Alkalisalibacterium limincola TaxID=2699169 RepID=A0A5C8KI61_9GAMM|nr:cyclopropane-fatty-acyl-phospholipid synthase family protein [Alkalisalibacterium limincola]TXK59165.1 class I SAM-dependent methyltransferase [Alkalisalibacterium limincola]
MSLIDLCERGLVPDVLLRHGIRRMCRQRLRDEFDDDADSASRRYRDLIETLRGSEIAIETDAANEQHYEVPTRFFELCLGSRLKYSSCYYPRGNESLDEAEDAMLELYGERADLQDGQHILELGCGWGSLTLWMARRYPNARITGVSNSRSQRAHIMARCAALGIANVDIVTCDVNALQRPEAAYDRVVSVEMFEHVRNYQLLLERIGGWLKPGGILFVHIFCHRHLMYPFETQGEDNWMGRYFFTGGLMPAADTLLHFQDSLALEQRWMMSGKHYQATANHWLENQDENRAEVESVLRPVYGDDTAIWMQRWRMFWMACAELFGYRDGNEWQVAHYRFRRR